jgi:hypothetical protein
MAIPLRRSLAAGMDKDVIGYNGYIVQCESLKALQRGERGAYMRFGNLQL